MKNMKLQILLSAIAAMALTSSAATIHWTGNENRWGGGSLTVTADDNFSTIAGGTTYQKVSDGGTYEHVYDESAMAGGNFAVSMNRANNTINSLTVSGNTGFTFDTVAAKPEFLGGPVTVSGGTHTFNNAGAITMAVTTNTTWDIAEGASLNWNIPLVESTSGMTLTKTGAGTLILNGTSTYTGNTAINDGVFGGSASLAGNLSFADAAKLVFNVGYTLTVAAGKQATFDGSFGIADLGGLSSEVSTGTYTLISGNVDFSNIGNVGLANAAVLGGGKSAYFQTNGNGDALVTVFATPTDQYAVWATLCDLEGGRTDDDDGDGQLNVYEYGLGGDPTNSASLGILPVSAVVPGGMQYIHVKLSDANSGVTYTVKVTDDLVAPAWTTNGVDEVGVGVLDAKFNIVTNQVSTAVKDAQFIRLIIE
jgi:autotransporter-associated beta strand protein